MMKIDARCFDFRLYDFSSSCIISLVSCCDNLPIERVYNFLCFLFASISMSLGRLHCL